MLRKPLPLSDAIFIGSSQLSAADTADRPTVEVSLTMASTTRTGRLALHLCTVYIKVAYIVLPKRVGIVILVGSRVCPGGDMWKRSSREE